MASHIMATNDRCVSPALGAPSAERGRDAEEPQGHLVNELHDTSGGTYTEALRINAEEHGARGRHRVFRFRACARRAQLVAADGGS